MQQIAALGRIQSFLYRCQRRSAEAMFGERLKRTAGLVFEQGAAAARTLAFAERWRKARVEWFDGELPLLFAAPHHLRQQIAHFAAQ